MNNQRSVSSLIAQRRLLLVGIVGLGLALGVGSIAQAQVAVEHSQSGRRGEGRSRRRGVAEGGSCDRCIGQRKRCRQAGRVARGNRRASRAGELHHRGVGVDHQPRFRQVDAVPVAGGDDADAAHARRRGCRPGADAEPAVALPARRRRGLDQHDPPGRQGRVHHRRRHGGHGWRRAAGEARPAAPRGKVDPRDRGRRHDRVDRRRRGRRHRRPGGVDRQRVCAAVAGWWATGQCTSGRGWAGRPIGAGGDRPPERPRRQPSVGVRTAAGAARSKGGGSRKDAGRQIGRQREPEPGQRWMDVLDPHGLPFRRRGHPRRIQVVDRRVRDYRRRKEGRIW